MNPIFTSGCTRTPGLHHLHVDGVKSSADLEAIINHARKLGFPSETLIVAGCIKNHSRTDIVSAEGHHEINSPDDHISTTLIEPWQADTVNKLIRFILVNFAGATIELEHVVGHLADGQSEWLNPTTIKLKLDLAGISFISPQFLPIEYHHAIDLPTTIPAPDLNEWMADTLNVGVMVGTWYAFQRHGQHALRSNVFAGIKNIRERVEREHAIFRELCKRRGWDNYPIRTVVERVLGIWSSPK